MVPTYMLQGAGGGVGGYRHNAHGPRAASQGLLPGYGGHGGQYGFAGPSPLGMHVPTAAYAVAQPIHHPQPPQIIQQQPQSLISLGMPASESIGDDSSKEDDDSFNNTSMESNQSKSSASRMPHCSEPANYGIQDETNTSLYDLRDGSDGPFGKPPYPYLLRTRVSSYSPEDI